MRKYAVQNFVRGDLVWAVRGIPSEMVAAWHDSHRVSPWLKYWCDPSQRSESGSDVLALGAQSYYDWRLWHRLGVASDLVLVFIAVCVFVLAIGAGI